MRARHGCKLYAVVHAPAGAHACFSWLAYGNDARLPHSDSTFFQVCPPSCLATGNELFV